MSLFSNFTHWLHGCWPAGTVEKLPFVNEDGTTNAPGVRIVGDLTGVPLLKFSGDTGSRAVEAILKETDFSPGKDSSNSVLDLAIIGGGVSGVAAAIEAKKAGLHFKLFESVAAFSTIRNFPRRKPIYTYPTEMKPAGEMQFHSDIKEDLLDELEAYKDKAGIEPVMAYIEKLSRKDGVWELHHSKGESFRAHRVIIAIGRSGNYRKLGVPGEALDKVSNRLHDSNDYKDKDVLVVGGGDSALETSIALVEAGARVSLSYRKNEFSRPKPGNIEKVEKLSGSPLDIFMGSEVEQIAEKNVQIKNANNKTIEIANDNVFVLIGREAPLDFFRRSGIRVNGEWTRGTWAGFGAFFLFCFCLFHWKVYYVGIGIVNPESWMKMFSSWAGSAAQDKATLLYTLIKSASGPSFYYTLAYCTLVLVFGVRRIRRRKTPYITLQTSTLMAIQCLPLFILPELILPWMGRNGFFSDGAMLQSFADMFFEPYDSIGEERAYWRAYGFILAWPLMVYNWFTSQPMWGWLILGFVQTFVLIPLLIRRWGKGAYCGWICSCGALAETLGDTHRHKMLHGSRWNRLNMIGQVVLFAAFALLFLRILGWVFPGTIFEKVFEMLFTGIPVLNYKWIVDVFFAGILGVGFYFHFSGRIWCRFACPLAALMHIYARFSNFRIFADKKKCISCNVCTTVCHQGIDIMNFANKGRPMEDPECVRCSACVQSCPTGVLSFGRYGDGNNIIYDKLAASPVQIREEQQMHASALLQKVDQ